MSEFSKDGEERKKFKSSNGERFLALGIAVAVSGLCASNLVIGEVTWVSYGLLGVAVFSWGGVFESLTTTMSFGGDSLEIHKWFRKTVVSRENIKGVHIAKGCPVIIRLLDGGQIDLPDVNASPMHLRNTISAWAKKGS